MPDDLFLFQLLVVKEALTSILPYNDETTSGQVIYCTQNGWSHQVEKKSLEED